MRPRMKYPDDFINKVICGDTRELIKELPDNSIDCLITSPPYWGLRDYGIEPTVWGGKADCAHVWGGIKIKPIKLQAGNPEFQREWREHATNEKSSQGQFCIHCNAWLGCLGLEPTFEMYIDHLIEIFAEVKRVLKPSGTCWVNLGDSYSGSGNGAGDYRENGASISKNDNKYKGQKPGKSNIPIKSQCCIPERFAIAMIDRLGWIKRNTIIWHKRNAMPSSAKDRFTVDFESVFFFVKSKKYYFEQQKEPYLGPMNRWGGDKLKANGKSDWDGGTGQDTYRNRNMRPNPDGRNKRCVWDINTQPFPEAHFAVYPPLLIEPMIKAGCHENGIVLDIFMGSGTTAMVAKQLNRNYIGFEANPEYVQMSEKRLRNTMYNEQLAL